MPLGVEEQIAITVAGSIITRLCLLMSSNKRRRNYLHTLRGRPSWISGLVIPPCGGKSKLCDILNDPTTVMVDLDEDLKERIEGYDSLRGKPGQEYRLYPKIREVVREIWNECKDKHRIIVISSSYTALQNAGIKDICLYMPNREFYNKICASHVPRQKELFDSYVTLLQSGGRIKYYDSYVQLKEMIKTNYSLQISL